MSKTMRSWRCRLCRHWLRPADLYNRNYILAVLFLDTATVVYPQSWGTRLILSQTGKEFQILNWINCSYPAYNIMIPRLIRILLERQVKSLTGLVCDVNGQYPSPHMANAKSSINQMWSFHSTYSGDHQLVALKLLAL